MLSNTRRFWLLIASLALVVPLVLAACGDADDDDDDNGNGNGETPTEATSDGEGDADDDDEDANGDAGEVTWDDPIVFADPGFDSAIFHNRVMQYIVEHGYGYETDAIPAETTTMVQGVLNNDIQVLSEMWLDQVPALIEGIEDGEIVDYGTNYGESIQGFFVPTYMIEGDEERGIEPMAPDLEHVDDLPEYADLFEAADTPGIGRMYNCIGAWECSRINEAKLEAYGLDEDYEAFDPGSGPALASSLVSAYEQGEPWFGYYWAPTWIFSQYDLTQIEEPEYTDECWEEIFEGEEACAYPSVRVHIGANAEFAVSAPDISEFLENYESSMDETNDVLFYMNDNEADADEAAIWWLEENEDTWTDWVPEDVAEDVLAALDEGLEVGD
ncbi:MAG: ABC transporter substrate-binding protein [Chloroflexota bacterium]